MSTQKNEHNPDNLTPEQYGAPEFRLLNIGEPLQSGDEIYFEGTYGWVESLSEAGRIPNRATYRRRIAPPTETTGSGREGETVETDKAHLRKGDWSHMDVVDIQFARQLERQRDAALAVIRQTALDTADPSDDLETKRRIIHKRCRAAIDSAQRQEGV